MTWSQARARQRVRQFMTEAPEIKGALPDYSGGDLQARQRVLREQAGVNASGPLSKLSPSTAIVVDGVHVYVQLLGFDDMLLENARETEASHRRALTLLHFYYRLLDRLVLEGGGIRVDFHAARMHFVVAEPAGALHARERLDRALAIVEALEEAAISLPAQLGLSIARAPLRVGVDQGACIAIANDRGHELDTVFLGTPANMAAKLAAGEAPGVYLSASVRALLGLPPIWGLPALRQSPAPAFIRALVKKSADFLVERTTDAIEQAEFAAPNFVFQTAELPLGKLKFGDLSPGRSVRMDMAAVFADIDAFTNYVEASMRAGAGRSVVRTMFVLREEQRAVLREDFKAKRLRFVGDCVIGLSASGEGRTVSAAKTVEDAVRCAAALHSSLEVCREEIADAEPLGLQVGIGFGASPLTRLGIRGDMSVRCAASRAIMQAEECQARAERGETVVAQSALSVSTRVTKLASGRGGVTGKFAAVEILLSGAPIQLAGATTTSRPAPPFRAHGGGDR